MLVFLGVAAQSQAATRYAVPGGGTGDASCMSVMVNCSLAEVLENVVATGDEVIVTPGTYDVGSMGVYIKNGSTALNIHGEDGRARPTITAAATGGGVRTCVTTSCSRAGTILRHLAIENTGSGSALDFWGGAVGDPITIDDVEAVAGSNLPAIIGFAQTGVPSAGVIRDTPAYAP